jgi:hypothetical protein
MAPPVDSYGIMFFRAGLLQNGDENHRDDFSLVGAGPHACAYGPNLHIAEAHLEGDVAMTQLSADRDDGKLNRRTFIKAGAATALTAASWSRVYGANERIGIGMIGIGLMGRIHTAT